jgi:hypothetical protein
MNITQLRGTYHRRVCEEIIRLRKDEEDVYPNFADKGSSTSRAIALGIVERLNCDPSYEALSGQTAGNRFEGVTRDYIEKSFALLHHLRPGKWYYSTAMPISYFDQYEHLADLEDIIAKDSELASALGKDYIVKPDIVVGRWPVTDEQVNARGLVVDPQGPLARLTPLRSSNRDAPRVILHASISCKWTLRTDRAQNARTEALNLIRNRKGRLPHVVAVTAEPYMNRIASLALGTGDLDCVYHFALYELTETIEGLGFEDQLDLLRMMVEGRRLRDISDLLFDLAA